MRLRLVEIIFRKRFLLVQRCLRGTAQYTYIANTLVYAFGEPGGELNEVMFWDTKLNKVRVKVKVT